MQPMYYIGLDVHNRRSLACAIHHSLVQLLDLRFESGVHRLQLTRALSSVRCQR
jgi:hypothetical protein